MVAQSVLRLHWDNTLGRSEVRRAQVVLVAEQELGKYIQVDLLSSIKLVMSRGGGIQRNCAKSVEVRLRFFVE